MLRYPLKNINCSAEKVKWSIFHRTQANLWMTQIDLNQVQANLCRTVFKSWWSGTEAKWLENIFQRSWALRRIHCLFYRLISFLNLLKNLDLSHYWLMLYSLKHFFQYAQIPYEFWSACVLTGKPKPNTEKSYGHLWNCIS